MFVACSRRVERVINDANEDTVEPFRTVMRRFVEQGTCERLFTTTAGSCRLHALLHVFVRPCCVAARVDVSEQETLLRDARDRFRHCCVFFTVLPRPGQSDVEPKDFFPLWAAFCDDFKTAWKREHQRLVKLR